MKDGNKTKRHACVRVCMAGRGRRWTIAKTILLSTKNDTRTQQCLRKYVQELVNIVKYPAQLKTGVAGGDTEGQGTAKRTTPRIYYGRVTINISLSTMILAERTK